MLWIIVIGIIGYIAYSFLKDRDSTLKRQVDMQGGMAKKYEYLIGKMTDDPSMKVVKVTRDHINIRGTSTTSTTNFLITESFNSVVIEWIGQLSIYGTHNKKWTFVHNYPQEKMLQEIETFLKWKSKEIFGK